MTPSDRATARRERALNSVLRIKAYRRMWASIGTSSAGDWLGLLAMMGLAALLTSGGSTAGQAAAISGVLIVRLLPDLIFAPIAAVIADKFDRRKTVIVGEILAALLYLMIALTYDIRTMYVGQFLIEAIGLVTMASKQTLWMSTVPRDKIPVGNQILMFTIYGSFPLSAGIYTLLATAHSLFVEVVDPPAITQQKFVVLAALFLDSATYLVSAAIIFRSRHLLPSAVEGKEQQPAGIFKLLSEGIKFVFGNRVIRALYTGVIGAFAAAGMTVGVALTYVNSLNAGFAGYGILLGTAFSGLAIGMLAGPKVLPSLSRKRIFGLSIAIAGGFLIGMGLAQDFVLGVILAAGVGFFAGMAWILGYTMIGQEVEDRIRGRTFTFVVSSARIMLMLALALGPVLSSLFGSREIDLGGVSLRFSGSGMTLTAAGIVAVLIGLYAGRNMGHRPPRRRSMLARLGDSGVLLGAGHSRGLFIAIESPNRELSGRQAKALAARLTAEGLPVLLTGEPTDSGVGARIATFMDDVASGDIEPAVLASTSVFLAAADRAEHVDKVIRPALEAGKVVVCSGFVDTTIAFFGSGSDNDTEEVLRMSAWANEGLTPDLTILLDVAYEAENPLADVRESFLRRREATLRDYPLVVHGSEDDTAAEVLRHASSAVIARRDFIAPAAVGADG